MRERVWLARQRDYGPSLEEKIAQAFTALGVWDELRPGMTVVVKPNLVMSSKPEQAIITHPAFTAAVGKCVKKAGGKVLIAESPGGPYTPGAIKAIFRATGYTDMAESCGFSLYTACKSRAVTLPHAQRCRGLSVVEPFLDRDYLIDLAKLKTHGMVGFSGAVKNLFGAVPGLQKPEAHCRFPEREPFSEMLVDLCDFLRPDLCFLDGVWAMEGNGPTGGQRRDLGVLAASKSPYAADVAAASLVGLDPGKIDMLRIAHSRGLGRHRPRGAGAFGRPPGVFGRPGLSEGPGRQHRLYRPAAEAPAPGGEKTGHPLAPHRQKPVRGLRQVRRKLPPAHHPHPGGQGENRLQKLHPLLLLPRDVPEACGRYKTAGPVSLLAPGQGEK